MSKLIGVRFDKCEPLIYYVTGAANPVKGDYVIAETEMGVELGKVILDDCDEAQIEQKPIRSIIRVAVERDLEKIKDYKTKEEKAFGICKEKIKKHKLDMKLIKVKALFDNKKLLFYFYSTDRVDFRELVKELAAIFRTRIELRQVGVRDETKLTGGLGVCGREMCCSSCMTDFEPVSINMAKEQNLSLNPASISGFCGRLMCCLGYENETYSYLHSKLPSIGDTVEAEGETGKVTAVNILKQTVKVLVSDESDDTDIKEYGVDDIKVIEKKASESLNGYE